MTNHINQIDSSAAFENIKADRLSGLWVLVGCVLLLSKARNTIDYQ